MLKSFLNLHIRYPWRRALAMLLVLLSVLGMFPATAFAAEAGGAAYPATGDFEVNIAGATGWTGRSTLSPACTPWLSGWQRFRKPPCPTVRRW